jgi:hypothetical protein
MYDLKRNNLKIPFINDHCILVAEWNEREHKWWRSKERRNANKRHKAKFKWLHFQISSSHAIYVLYVFSCKNYFFTFTIGFKNLMISEIFRDFEVLLFWQKPLYEKIFFAIYWGLHFCENFWFHENRFLNLHDKLRHKIFADFQYKISSISPETLANCFMILYTLVLFLHKSERLFLSQISLRAWSSLLNFIFTFLIF